MLLVVLLSLPLANAALQSDFKEITIDGKTRFTNKNLVDSDFIIASDKVFYGSNTGQVSIELYLQNNVKSGDYFIGLETRSKSISLNSISINGSTRNLFLSPSKTFRDDVLFSLDSKTTKIILNISFDPEVIGIREEFDIVIYNSLGVEVARYDPFISGFIFRQELTLNTNGISLSADADRDLTILVHIPATNTDFWDNESFGTGNGITFAQGGDEITELDFDIEDFDAGVDDANIWVEYTETFDSTTDSTMFLYYGGTDTDNSDGTATYPSTYTAVYHLNETTGSDMFDATSNNFDLNNVNTPTLGEDSQIGKGIKYERTNAENSNNNTLLDDGFSKLTLAFWVKKPTDWNSSQVDQHAIFFKANTGTSEDRISMVWRPDGSMQWAVLQGVTADVLTTSKTTWAAETWFHIVATFDSVNNLMAIYVDDSNSTGGVRANAMDVVGSGTDSNFFIGDAPPFGSSEADETVDEFKVFRNVVLTSDEITLLFNSESDNLITFGPEEGGFSADFTAALTPNGLDPENNADSVIVTLTDTSVSGGISITDWNYFIDGSQFFHSTVNGNTTRELTSIGDFNFALIITNDNNLMAQKDVNVSVSTLVQNVDINFALNTFSSSNADINFGVTFTGDANVFNWGFPGDQNQLTQNITKTFSAPESKTVCVTITNLSDANKTVCEDFIVGRVIVKKPLDISTLAELTPFDMTASDNPAQSFSALSADTNFFFFLDVTFSSSINIDFNTDYFPTSRLFDFTSTSNDFVFQPFLVTQTGNLASIIFTINNINQKQTIPDILIVSETVISGDLVIVESKESDITGTAEFHFEVGRTYTLSFFDSDGVLLFSGQLDAKSVDTELFAALAERVIFVSPEPGGIVNISWIPVVGSVQPVDGNVTLTQLLTPFNTVIGDVNIFITHLNDTNVIFNTVFTLDSSAADQNITFDVNVSGFNDNFPLNVNLQIFDTNGVLIGFIQIKEYYFIESRIISGFEALKTELGEFPVMFISVILAATALGLVTFFSQSVNNNWVGVIGIVLTGFFVIISWIPIEAWLIATAMTIGMFLWRDREQ